MKYLIHQIRVINILWSGNMLLDCGTKDRHVEGSSWMGRSYYFHLCALVAWGHGGSSDCSGGTQESKSRKL